jgi:serine protease
VLTKDDAAASTTTSNNEEQEEEADFVLQANIMAQYDGAITDVVIPKIVSPPGETPDFTANQNYLLSNSATDSGIDAEYSWTFPGGDGEGITIYDVEYAWNLQHEDLTVMKDVKELVGGIGDAGVDLYAPLGNWHGTAVLGELLGTLNDFGVTGISPGAKAKVAPEYTIQLGSARANSITLAVNDALQDGIPNDVILLEMQMTTCGMPSDKYGPAEDQLDVFEATQVAVLASGIVVVAAAGNGDINLDDPACLGKYDRAVRDSGAIIVGAGGSGRGIGCSPARRKMGLSTYGSRVDVHGWGDCVWTTGYGDGHKDSDAITDETKWYTAGFYGTSSASPIVAAAVANIQGIAIQAFGAPLKPKDVRQLLSDTGLAQEGDTSEHIGPLVNLRGAIDKLLLSVPPTNTPTSNPTTTTAAPTNAPTTNPTVSPTTKSTSNPSSKSSKQATKSSKSKLSAPKSKASK